jgi:hypothetical protein
MDDCLFKDLSEGQEFVLPIPKQQHIEYRKVAMRKGNAMKNAGSISPQIVSLDLDEPVRPI